MSFDWQPAKEVLEAAIGPDSLVVDQEGLGASIYRRGTLVALVLVKQGVLHLSFRASTPPNTAALVCGNLMQVYVISLDPYFELDNNGNVLLGNQASRFFAENAQLLLFGERQKSKDSIKVRPKGAYLKHNFN